jgi:hypothetical protein
VAPSEFSGYGWGRTGYTALMAGSQDEMSKPRRRIIYANAEGQRTLEAAKAVRGEIVEYDAHGRPARRTKFFLDRRELPWLPVSEPAFLLWVLVGLFLVWLVIGFVLIT